MFVANIIIIQVKRTRQRSSSGTGTVTRNDSLQSSDGACARTAFICEFSLRRNEQKKPGFRSGECAALVAMCRILANWPRLYRRKPQKWQNTCSYIRYPFACAARRAKWSRNHFSSEQHCTHCVSRVCVCVCVQLFFLCCRTRWFCLLFFILGKPQKPEPACNNRIVYNFTCVFIRDNNSL